MPAQSLQVPTSPLGNGASNGVGASPLERPLNCRMRPISPVEVVKQLISAKRQSIGKSKWEAGERAAKLSKEALDAARKDSYNRRLQKEIVAARAKAKQLERILATAAKLRVNDHGGLDWAWEEDRRRREAATGPDRNQRLDRLVKMQADALAGLIGLNVAQTRTYLQKLSKQIEAV